MRLQNFVNRSARAASAEASGAGDVSSVQAQQQKEAFITWEEFQRDCLTLASVVADRKWQGIIAITRGGMFPAGQLACELDIRHIETYCISTYSDKKLGHSFVHKPVDGSIVAARGKGWLVVDDLVDTGHTLNLLRAQLPEAYFATVYAKPEGMPLVQSFVRSFPQDCWIVFPWDTKGGA